MDAIEIIVTKDVKRAAIRETLNKYHHAVATLCRNTSTGCAEVRRIGADDEIGDMAQVIDLSETDAYGSYIDSLVPPEARLDVPGHTEVLALWDTGDNFGIDRLADEYRALVTDGTDDEWDNWVLDNVYGLYTMDDAAFDLWEMIVEDIEEDGRYAVIEVEE